MILYTTADAPIAIKLRICLSETFEKQHPTLEGFVRGREIVRTMSGQSTLRRSAEPTKCTSKLEKKKEPNDNL